MASIAALPTVATLVGCTDLGKTVYPYLHQLSLDHVLPLLRREVEAKAWYVSTNPLMSAAAFALALSVITFVAAEFNRNYSQVDRLWSILPALYTVHFAVWAHANGIGSERVDTMATLIVLWGVRVSPHLPRA